MTIPEAAVKYLWRCRIAGDQRPVYELLEEIVQPELIVQITQSLAIHNPTEPPAGLTWAG